MAEGHRCQSARQQSGEKEETLGWGREGGRERRRYRGHPDKGGTAMGFGTQNYGGQISEDAGCASGLGKETRRLRVGKVDHETPRDSQRHGARHQGSDRIRSKKLVRGDEVQKRDDAYCGLSLFGNGVYLSLTAALSLKDATFPPSKAEAHGRFPTRPGWFVRKADSGVWADD